MIRTLPTPRKLHQSPAPRRGNKAASRISPRRTSSSSSPALTQASTPPPSGATSAGPATAFLARPARRRRLAPALFSPFEESLLLDLNFGITNTVQRATVAPMNSPDDEAVRRRTATRGQSQTLAPHGCRLRRHRLLPHRLRHQRCPRQTPKVPLRRRGPTHGSSPTPAA